MEMLTYSLKYLPLPTQEQPVLLLTEPNIPFLPYKIASHKFGDLFQCSHQLTLSNIWVTLTIPSYNAIQIAYRQEHTEFPILLYIFTQSSPFVYSFELRPKEYIKWDLRLTDCLFYFEPERYSKINTSSIKVLYGRINS